MYIFNWTKIRPRVELFRGQIFKNRKITSFISLKESSVINFHSDQTSFVEANCKENLSMLFLREISLDPDLNLLGNEFQKIPSYLTSRIGLELTVKIS